MSSLGRVEYDQQAHRLQEQAQYKQEEDLEESEIEEGPKEKRTGRRKIKIEYIDDKSRRHITFSKRKAGIMKKAYELSTLTGTQVLLLVASETGHVYTFATTKLQPLITKTEGKTLIQSCLNAPDVVTSDSLNFQTATNTTSNAQNSIYNSSSMPSPQVSNEAKQESSPQPLQTQKITLQSQMYNDDSTQSIQHKQIKADPNDLFNNERKIFQQPPYHPATPTMQYNNLSPLQTASFSPQAYQQATQQQPTTPNNQLTSNAISVNSPYMYQYSSTGVQPTAGYQTTYGNMVGSAAGYFTPTSMSSPQATSQSQLPQTQTLQTMSSLRQQPTPPQYTNAQTSQNHHQASQRASRRVHPYQRSPHNQTAPPTPQSNH